MQKITKAMKMVAAAKLKGDTNRLDKGLPFCTPVQNLMERLPREDKAGSMLVVGLTSDKGLCGGVNTQVAKGCRETINAEEAKGNATKYMCVGGKGVAVMKRLYGDRFEKTFEEVTKVPWNYTTASLVAERIIASNPDRLTVCWNYFKNIVSYDSRRSHVITKTEAKGMDKTEWSKAIDVYSFEPSTFEVWDDLHEFYYSAVIHGSYLNNTVCEQAQRMSAMENASKNAGEIFEKVQLQFNRARQAKITTELCEIISGASAV